MFSPLPKKLLHCGLTIDDERASGPLPAKPIGLDPALSPSKTPHRYAAVIDIFPATGSASPGFRKQWQGDPQDKGVHFSGFVVTFELPETRPLQPTSPAASPKSFASMSA